MYNYSMVKNLTNGKIISEKIKHAKNFTDKTFGMILKKNADGLIFRTRLGVHTFFMREPIDILILDTNNNVRVVKKVYPNKIFLWNPKFATVIELPDGSLNRSKTKIGDTLEF